MTLLFEKYQATGNDFILLDNRGGTFDNISEDNVASLCDRRFGIGGDGLMMLCSKKGYDFEMRYFNADGALGSMCGNGGRCITAFAKKCGIDVKEYRFLAYDGEHFSRFDNENISLKMNPVSQLVREGAASILDTGSPHYVLPVQDVARTDVFTKGREIRNSEAYRAKGINVNFVQQIDDHSIFVRTYERGVEDETYSCGTGVTAAAIASAGDEDRSYDFHIRTRGGSLRVSFIRQGNQFTDIWLTGPAVHVFSGEITI